jgi:hypothetical protein
MLGVPGGVLGPWNGGAFDVRIEDDGPTADGSPVIAYHFQSLRLRRTAQGLPIRVAQNAFRMPPTQPPLEAYAQPHYRLSPAERRVFWRPYVARLGQAVVEVIEREPGFAQAVAQAPTPGATLAAIREHVGLQASRVLVPPVRAVRRRINLPRSARSV